MSSDETIWVTDPAPPVASTRLIRASVYAEKSARVWDGGDNVFIDLFIGHLELSGAIRAWREVAETLNAAIAEIDRFLLERDGLAADVPDAVKRRALAAVAVHFGHVSEPVCGAEPSGRISLRPEDVTCPDCRAWLDVNAIARADRQRESEASEAFRVPDEVEELHDAAGGEEG